jgi:hypothetical protein
MAIIAVVVVVTTVLGFGLGKYKGYSWSPYVGAILGFLLGLIGVVIIACIPSTPQAKALRAHAKAVKAGIIPAGEHEAIPTAPAEPQIPPDLHEEHNLPAGT